jgi:hypothetical protein
MKYTYIKTLYSGAEIERAKFWSLPSNVTKRFIYDELNFERGSSEFKILNFFLVLLFKSA